MGLDTIEIVLRIEETFGVDLPDDELGSVKTVGDLYKVLLTKLGDGYACLSSRAFYRIRLAMTEVLRVNRRSIRPSSDLAALLKRRSRHADWKAIELKSGLRFPRLKHPAWFHWTAFLFCVSLYALMVILIAPLYFHDFPKPVSGLKAISLPFAVAVILIPMGMAFLRVLTPFLGFVLPVDTVGALARKVLSSNYSLLTEGVSKTGHPDKEEVWHIVQEIFVDQLQVEREEVVPEANILHDLRCD